MQYHVDCDFYNNGCQGGLPYRLFKFIRDQGYLFAADYAYKDFVGKRATCMEKRSASKKQYYKTMNPQGFMNVTANDIQLLLQYQPLSVAVNTPSCFNFYDGGVLSEADCPCAI